MNKLVPVIIKELEAGQELALATILTRHGSTPRTAGAEMIMRMDGSISGTVGGGQLEAKTMVTAQTVLASKQPEVKEFYMTGKDAASTDMICGGNQEILIEYLDLGDTTLVEQLKIVNNLINQRKRGWWITRLGKNSDGSLIVEHGVIGDPGEINLPDSFQNEIKFQLDKKSIQWVGLPDPVYLKSIRSTRIVEVGSVLWIVDPIDLQGTVYLFGGGHVSQQVAKITNQVGFRTVVIDDRPEFVTEEKFPLAEERVFVPSFEDCFEKLTIDPMSFLVIVTRGHLCDHAVLRQALKTDAVYVGMIGSKRKNMTILNALAEEGFSGDALEKVNAPIGLEIDAETPEEIAVSIVAELIKVRAAILK